MGRECVLVIKKLTFLMSTSILIMVFINTQEANNISINFNHLPVAVFNKAQFECQSPFANCVLMHNLNISIKKVLKKKEIGTGKLFGLNPSNSQSVKTNLASLFYELTEEFLSFRVFRRLSSSLLLHHNNSVNMSSLLLQVFLVELKSQHGTLNHILF